MKTTHLQGIGTVPATEAKNLKPGMTIMWNFGYKSLVVGTVLSKTGKSLTIRTQSSETGRIYERKTTPDRLFAVV